MSKKKALITTGAVVGAAVVGCVVAKIVKNVRK